MKKNLYLPIVAVAVINFILFTIKLYIGLRSNSFCIYTDGINNLMDTLSAVLVFISIAFMFKKSSNTHPFGFGRMEYVTSFIISIIMVFSGISFCFNSLERFLAPTPIWYFKNFAIIIGITCLVKLFLGIVFVIHNKKEQSPIFKTIMLDSFLDCSITFVTLISFTLSHKIGFTLDAFLGLAISISITVSGIRLVVSSLSQVIGCTDGKTEKEIADLISNINNGVTINKITVHNYGRNCLWADICLTSNNSNEISDIQRDIKHALKYEMNINTTIEWEVHYEQ